jgi:two-component system C4-dicarboxylate transport sensor histidine kinase DctB
VRCDTTRLEQVLVNLIGNAVDAMTDAPLRRLQLTAVAERSRVRVQVIDTGRGLSQAQQARLFEPFFTTKPAGQGLGLGLVISAKIVHEFGGTLVARSSDQGGMVFEFDLEQAGGEGDV